MQPGLMVRSVHLALLVPVINYIRTLSTFFILIFMLACTVDTTQKINSQKNVDKKTKANVTFSASVGN